MAHQGAPIPDSDLSREHRCYVQIRFDDVIANALTLGPLRDMDKIVYPVCKLCRDHEKAGFIEGIRLGVLLAQEVAP